MATLRDIRRRISSVKNTQKITNAMKMVAAAKLRRAQENMLRARPYAKKMAEMLHHLSTKVNKEDYPELTIRPVRSVAIVVVTADRGLCGAFNANIIRTTVNHIETNYRDLRASGKLTLACVGKKGMEFFVKRGYPVKFKHPGVFHSLNFNTAKDIATEIVNGYRAGEYDKVEIIYNEFKNVAQQHVVIDQVLPIIPAGNDAAKNHSLIDYIYEPSSDEIISSLVPKHLNFQLWHVMLESNAAEQGAKMTAMENATTNAKELIRTLTLSYNKARQASITKELLEIVSGANALKQED
jgi:F-type H+-transporting ATPase subunit gamma